MVPKLPRRRVTIGPPDELVLEVGAGELESRLGLGLGARGELSAPVIGGAGATLGVRAELRGWSGWDFLLGEGLGVAGVTTIDPWLAGRETRAGSFGGDVELSVLWVDAGDQACHGVGCRFTLFAWEVGPLLALWNVSPGVVWRLEGTELRFDARAGLTLAGVGDYYMTFPRLDLTWEWKHFSMCTQLDRWGTFVSFGIVFGSG
jgi:hypothetical protein